MRSRAKRWMASWNMRSSSLSAVKGGGGAVEVSAKFGMRHLVTNLQLDTIFSLLAP
jgi:hypothetical protein